MPNMSNRVFVFLGMIFWISCHPGHSKISKGPSRPNTITIGISQEPDSLFSPFKEMMVSEEIMRVGTYTLTVFDEH